MEHFEFVCVERQLAADFLARPAEQIPAEILDRVLETVTQGFVALQRRRLFPAHGGQSAGGVARKCRPRRIVAAAGAGLQERTAEIGIKEHGALVFGKQLGLPEVAQNAVQPAQGIGAEGADGFADRLPRKRGKEVGSGGSAQIRRVCRQQSDALRVVGEAAEEVPELCGKGISPAVFEQMIHHAGKAVVPQAGKGIGGVGAVLCGKGFVELGERFLHQRERNAVQLALVRHPERGGQTEHGKACPHLLAEEGVNGGDVRTAERENLT